MQVFGHRLNTDFLQQDGPAGLVVFLIALPLCLEVVEDFRKTADHQGTMVEVKHVAGKALGPES